MAGAAILAGCLLLGPWRSSSERGIQTGRSRGSGGKNLRSGGGRALRPSGRSGFSSASPPGRAPARPGRVQSRPRQGPGLSPRAGGRSRTAQDEEGRRASVLGRGRVSGRSGGVLRPDVQRGPGRMAGVDHRSRGGRRSEGRSGLGLARREGLVVGRRKPLRRLDRGPFRRGGRALVLESPPRGHARPGPEHPPRPPRPRRGRGLRPERARHDPGLRRQSLFPAGLFRLEARPALRLPRDELGQSGDGAPRPALPDGRPFRRNGRGKSRPEIRAPARPGQEHRPRRQRPDRAPGRRYRLLSAPSHPGKPSNRARSTPTPTDTP